MIVNTICFIHIPKSGGTSIEKMILEQESNFFNYSYMKLCDYILEILKLYASFICSFLFIKPNDNYKNSLLIIIRIINDYMLKCYHSTYLLENAYIKSKISYHKRCSSNCKYKNIKFFSCVRHPQSRLVSLYTFLKPKINFNKFVIGILDNSKLDYPPKIAYQDQTSFLVNKKNEICVKWYKIEEITHKWQDICKYIDIPYKKFNNKKKNISQKDSENWKSYYDKYPYIVNIVKKYYKNDFINFNYSLYIPN